MDCFKKGVGIVAPCVFELENPGLLEQELIVLGAPHGDRRSETRGEQCDADIESGKIRQGDEIAGDNPCGHFIIADPTDLDMNSRARYGQFRNLRVGEPRTTFSPDDEPQSMLALGCLSKGVDQPEDALIGANETDEADEADDQVIRAQPESGAGCFAIDAAIEFADVTGVGYPRDRRSSGMRLARS